MYARCIAQDVECVGILKHTRYLEVSIKQAFPTSVPHSPHLASTSSNSFSFSISLDINKMSRNSNDDENNPFVAFRKVIDDQVVAATRLLSELPTQLNTVREDFRKNVEAADQSIERAFRRLGDAYERSTNPERTQIVRRGEETKHGVTQGQEDSRDDSKRRGHIKEWDTTRQLPFHPLDILAMFLEHPESDDLAGMHAHLAQSKQSTWPDSDYFLSGQYSPIRLEERSKLTGEVPIKKWRDAFEDLLLASKGEPLPEKPTIPWWKRRHQGPADWLESLQARKLISTNISISPMGVEKILGYLHTPDFGFVAQPDYDNLSEKHPVQELLKLMDVDWNNGDDVKKPLRLQQPDKSGQEDTYPGAQKEQMRQLPMPDATQGGALADYLMQLMLLEQQNKRRLLIARQEQESVTGTQTMNQPGLVPGITSQDDPPHELEKSSNQPHSPRLQAHTASTDTTQLHDELRQWLDFTPPFQPPKTRPPCEAREDSVERKTRGSIKTTEVSITPDGTRTTKTVWKLIGEDGQTHVTRTEESVEYMPKIQGPRTPQSSEVEQTKDDSESKAFGSSKVQHHQSSDSKTERAQMPSPPVRPTQPKRHLVNEVTMQDKDDEPNPKPKLEQERNIPESKTKSWLWDR